MPYQSRENYGASAVIYNAQTMDFFDAKLFQSQYASQLLFGQGIKFNSEDEEIKKYFGRLDKLNKFDDLLQQTAQAASYYGRAVWTIDKTYTGDFIISLIGDDLFQNIEKFEVTPFRAILMRRKVIGMNIYYITEEWTTTTVNRNVTVLDKQNKQRVPLNQANYNWLQTQRIPDELNVPTFERHNLGFIPVIEVTNQPSRNIISSDMTQLADDVAVRNMPIHINNGAREWFKDEILGKTRVFGYLSDDQLKKLETQGKTLGLALEDIIVLSKAMGDATKPIEVSPSSHDGKRYSEPMKDKIDLFMIGCKYSPVFGNQNDKTEAETLYSKDADQRTTKNKRRRYSELLNELFRKIFVYKGLMTSLDEDDKFSVEINENVVYNRLQLIEFMNSGIAAGLFSRVEAIAIMRDLDDLEQAEKIKTLIDKEAENDTFRAMEQEMTLQGNGGGIGKMRSGSDANPNSDTETK